MAKKKVILMIAMVLGISSTGLAQAKSNAQLYAESVDHEQIMFAVRWFEAFKRLDPRNNITITLAMDDNMVEINNVFRLEAYSRFLVLEARDDKGKNYKSIVYPSTILLIQERGR